MLLLQIAVGVAAGAAFARSGPRRAITWVLASVAPFFPWFSSTEVPLGRFVLAMGGVLILFHTIDLSRDPRDHSAKERVWFMLTPFDTRAARRVRPELRPKLVAAIVLWGTLSVAALWAVGRVHPVESVGTWLVRWALGAVGFYSAVEAVGALMYQGYLLGGIEPPPLHRLPIASRTVQEFWGERWNLEVRRWLHQHVFSPLARRRGVTRAMMMAFVGSTVLHVWLILPAGGLAMAGLWALFFLLQGVLIALERMLRVSRWRRPLAHAWTVSLFVLASPLFVEPLLRACGWSP